MTRLLCGECGDLQGIRYGAMDDEDVRLKCGHYRTTGLLPSAPGTVSIEGLNTLAGRIAFPMTEAAKLERSN